jgi:transposase
MRALDQDVVDVVRQAVEPLLPPPAEPHPLGCHRPRVPDRPCLRGILIRLVTGASWVDTEAIHDHQVPGTTLRARRDEWIDAGVFEQVRTEALEPTLDTVDQTGLPAETGALHLYRSYDSRAGRDRLHAAGLDQFEIQRRGTKIPGVKGQPLRLGLRWVVEATDTWWSNYGQLRRNTDRRARHRHAALCLATKQSSSSAASSTGATAATPPDRLSAQALSL